ncbi:hypothetical protein ACFQV4_12380 [Streptomyces thermocarboxydus]
MTDTTTETTTPAAQLERYTRFWNTGPDAERDRLAATVFTDEVEYRALVGFLQGAAALADSGTSSCPTWAPRRSAAARSPRCTTGGPASSGRSSPATARPSPRAPM